LGAANLFQLHFEGEVHNGVTLDIDGLTVIGTSVAMRTERIATKRDARKHEGARCIGADAQGRAFAA